MKKSKNIASGVGKSAPKAPDKKGEFIQVQKRTIKKK
jgi:hypothetical protein